MGASQVGVQARLMSQAMRKLSAAIAKTNCLVIFINQLREKVGVIYGNPETTTGGRALKFYASIRLDIRRAEALKAGTQIIGNSVKIKVVKNKVAPPFKSCVIDMIYGEGISKTAEILDVGEQLGIFEKSGSWYILNGNKIGNGRDACKQYLLDHPEEAAQLEAKIRAGINGEALLDDAE
jgi:recombination protein RecA